MDPFCIFKIIAIIILKITIFSENIIVSRIYILFSLLMNVYLYKIIESDLKKYLIPQIIWITFASIILFSLCINK
jgi:hypothetical protein